MNILDRAENLTNHFLIAMPGLADPNFYHTVTYMCDHNEEGAMGIVINRPLEMDLAELLSYLGVTDYPSEIGQVPIYQGGPVQTERGFVLHNPTGEWDATTHVSDQIDLTMSQDIIEAIAQGRGPEQYLISLGYAGWGKGQLENELVENAWLNGPAQSDIIFEQPVEQRWNASARLLGVDISQISHDVGHA